MAINGTDFWTQVLTILEGGNLTSDPSYYLPEQGGGAQSGEWGNIITVLFERTAAGSEERAQIVDLLAQAGFWDSSDDLDFWKNQEVNEQDINDLEGAAEERMPGLFDSSGNSVRASADAAPGTGDPSGIMGGGQLTKITGRDGGEDLWAIVFNVNGVKHVYTFNSYDDVIAAYGDPTNAPGGIGVMSWDEITDPNANAWLLGEADAFIGQTGSYNAWWDQTMYEAGLEAGVRNPGLLGDYLSQPEIQQILAMGAAGEWSQERIQAEIRRTDYYQNTLYPGISKFLDQGIPNPEGAYWNYMTNVTEALSALGYETDEFGTYRNQIGEMLEAGITVEEFNTFAPAFIRAEQSPEFAAALSPWVQRDLGIELDFDNWFDVLAGSSSAELDLVVEKATLQFVADNVGSNLDSDLISRLADLTDFSEQQMAVAFTNAEQALLSVGDPYLARYGLSQEALVNAAFGLESGNMSAGEITKQAQKAAQELGLQDDTKQGFFLGFDRFGRPTRQGLQATAPEAG